MTKFRTESDLIGDLQVPAEAYYGVQTQRAIENFRITGTKMGDYPEFVKVRQPVFGRYDSRGRRYLNEYER